MGKRSFRLIFLIIIIDIMLVLEVEFFNWGGGGLDVFDICI